MKTSLSDIKVPKGPGMTNTKSTLPKYISMKFQKKFYNLPGRTRPNQGPEVKMVLDFLTVIPEVSNDEIH